MYNLWKYLANLNDIGSKYSSSRSFQGHNLHPRAMDFEHALSFMLFFSSKQFFNSLISFRLLIASL